MNWDWRNFWKAIGTLLGSLTAGAVIAGLNIVNIDITPEMAGAIAVIGATLGTILAPKNVQTEHVVQDEV